MPDRGSSEHRGVVATFLELVFGTSSLSSVIIISPIHPSNCSSFQPRPSFFTITPTTTHPLSFICHPPALSWYSSPPGGPAPVSFCTFMSWVPLSKTQCRGESPVRLCARDPQPSPTPGLPSAGEVAAVSLSLHLGLGALGVELRPLPESQGLMSLGARGLPGLRETTAHLGPCCPGVTRGWEAAHTCRSCGFTPCAPICTSHILIPVPLLRPLAPVEFSELQGIWCSLSN